MKYIPIVCFFLLFNVIVSENKTNDTNIDKGIPNDEIYELSDGNFDIVIQNGNNYRWFVLFYVSTCGHCRRAKKEIKAVFDKKEYSSNLRFAQIETQSNVMTSIRFNITQIPYIVLMENNTMIEMIKYPNQNNIIDFIKTNFSNNTEDEILPIPVRPAFYYIAYVMLKEATDSLRMYIMRFLHSKGYDFEIKSYHLIIGFVGVFSVFILFECWLVSCCCKEDFDFAELEKKLKEKEQNKGTDTKKEDNSHPKKE